MGSVINYSFYENSIHVLEQRMDSLAQTYEKIKNIDPCLLIKQVDQLYAESLQVINTYQDSIKTFKKIIKIEDHLKEVEYLKPSLHTVQEKYKTLTDCFFTLYQSIKSSSKNTSIKKLKNLTALALKILHTNQERLNTINKKYQFKHYPQCDQTKLSDQWWGEQFRSILGDKPKIFDVINKIYLKKRLTSEDLNLLQNLIDSKNKCKELNIPECLQPSFFAFLSHIRKEIIQTMGRKKFLLKQLKQDYQHSNRDERDKFFFGVQLKQILENPFDIFTDVEVPEELQPLLELNLKVRNHLELTLKAKQAGLIRLKNFYQTTKSSPQQILISGAGPSGLLYALTLALKSQPFTLLEARGLNDDKRQNIVALGKNSIVQGLSDIKILDFFGISDDLLLKQQALLTEVEKNYDILEASIGDIQTSLIQQLEFLTGKQENELITYQAKIKTIESTEKNISTVTICLKDPKENIEKEMTFQPQVLIVLEGFKSSTRDLLGIEVQKLSQVSRMTFSFFKSFSTHQTHFLQTRLMKLKERLKYYFQTFVSFFTLLRTFFHFLRRRQDFMESLFHILGRAQILLETPKKEYFYMTLNKQEEELLRGIELNQLLVLENQRRLLDEVEDVLKSFPLTKEEKKVLDHFSAENRTKWLKDSIKYQIILNHVEVLYTKYHQSSDLNLQQHTIKKLDVCLKELKNLEQKIKKLAERPAFSGRNLSKLVYVFMRSAYKSQAMEYQSTQFAFSQVTKAETNLVQIGNMLAYVGGDAETTTDPVSGQGMRSAFMRNVHLDWFFGNDSMKHNLIAHSAFKFFSSRVAWEMRHDGLVEIEHYNPRSKQRIERYLDIVDQFGILNKDEQKQILKLSTKAKLSKRYPQFDFTKEDLQEIHTLIHRLLDAYHNLKSDPQHPVLNNQSLVDKAMNAFKTKHMRLSEKELILLEKQAIQLVIQRYTKNIHYGSILYLLVQLQKHSTTTFK